MGTAKSKQPREKFQERENGNAGNTGKTAETAIEYIESSVSSVSGGHGSGRVPREAESNLHKRFVPGTRWL